MTWQVLTWGSGASYPLHFLSPHLLTEVGQGICPQRVGQASAEGGATLQQAQVSDLLAIVAAIKASCPWPAGSSAAKLP